MANNFQECSAQLPLQSHQIDQAIQIVSRVADELEKDDCGYCGVQVDVDKDSVWFHHDDDGCINIDHLETIARALIEELEIDEPFFASWTYSCSKPRVNEFGGGALAIKRGMDTIWVDAMTCAQETLVEKEQMDACLDDWKMEREINE